MHGLAKYREYWHDVIGFNYRMTNICAAIGLAQLVNAKNKIERKRKLAEMYNSKLAGLPVYPHRQHLDVFHSYWMFSILVDTPDIREKLRDHLRNNLIETRPTFYTVHTMPMFSQKYQKLPVAEALGWRGINLPSWAGLIEYHVDEIVKCIRDFFNL